MASSSSEPLSPKSKVERFLATSWFNLLTRDDQLKQLKETVVGRVSGSKKRKRISDNSDDKQLESSEQAQRRGRPISNLAWLPYGWERITKRRTSGQKDTFYREIETSRTMRSSYDVTSYLEFGKVIKKNKERVKPMLEAKYGLFSTHHNFFRGINEIVNHYSPTNKHIVCILDACCDETPVPVKVYEYVPNGMLHHYIHELHGSLSWEARLRIAAMTAEALARLHSTIPNSLFHRGECATDVLFDEGMVAKCRREEYGLEQIKEKKGKPEEAWMNNISIDYISDTQCKKVQQGEVLRGVDHISNVVNTKVSDFGARLVKVNRLTASRIIEGSDGYLEPDFFISCGVTSLEKRDVYSFGMVMAELLMGELALSKKKGSWESCLGKGLGRGD
ncbi:hypothetical protein IEQ34_000427 [Dendrobium chrysotoxum]|uniref:Protein kinase domain-containing protein n=1 Tax=Dendrobium chrysotoxum TaxID=161865 RepID=A0AAV7HSE3_DENCH|nr:hypothetical protein IEQ34_000427 [Dendrobium chrysotoxum]